MKNPLHEKAIEALAEKAVEAALNGDLVIGMTMRDYFAAQVINGMFSGAAEEIPANPAKAAYKIADEMLAQRQQEK